MAQGQGEAFLARGLRGEGEAWPDSKDAFMVEPSVLVDWM